MATLTRLRSQEATENETVMDMHVPSPFPREILEEERARDARLEQEEVDEDPFADQPNLSENLEIATELTVEVDDSHARSSEEALVVSRRIPLVDYNELSYRIG